jgi:hypothetical protein
MAWNYIFGGMDSLFISDGLTNVMEESFTITVGHNLRSI